MSDGFLSRLLRGGFREQATRLRIDWMTHTDERVMELLEDGPATPPELAATLEKSEEYVADRCRQLAIRDLLSREDDTYRLTDRGAAYLAGEIGAEELAEDGEG
ncbi:phage repressor protein [Halalkalicoccus sp. NIPERK01]|uniref:phage repressor protein n=1 Tax=Halalkalicoccus sp. NIPERK01 TaxID=3053469 RepID=UPI00256F3A31|nr:phage repressor protein [Halalkalicoccus sp. NIPERK01]MDL5361658.1 phage repressor protein [Halalkalicoccus sp. NIPERK01]